MEGIANLPYKASQLAWSHLTSCKSKRNALLWKVNLSEIVKNSTERLAVETRVHVRRLAWDRWKKNSRISSCNSLNHWWITSGISMLFLCDGLHYASFWMPRDNLAKLCRCFSGWERHWPEHVTRADWYTPPAAHVTLNLGNVSLQTSSPEFPIGTGWMWFSFFESFFLRYSWP